MATGLAREKDRAKGGSSRGMAPHYYVHSQGSGYRGHMPPHKFVCGTGEDAGCPLLTWDGGGQGVAGQE